jgi:hypothetical protein
MKTNAFKDRFDNGIRMKRTLWLSIIFGCGALLLQDISYADSSKPAPQDQPSAPPEHAKGDATGNGRQAPLNQPSDSSQKAADDHVGKGKLEAGTKVEDYSAEDKLLRDKRPGSHLLNKKNNASHASVSKVTPKPAPTHLQRAAKTAAKTSRNLPAKAEGLHEPANGKSVAAVNKTMLEQKSSPAGKPRLAQNKPANNHSWQTPQSQELMAANGGAVRGRISQLTALGGPAIPHSRTGAALNGNSVQNRKY